MFSSIVNDVLESVILSYEKIPQAQKAQKAKKARKAQKATSFILDVFMRTKSTKSARHQTSGFLRLKCFYALKKQKTPNKQLACACSLIDPFIFWYFYKVLFESIPIFWNRRNCTGVQSQQISHFET